MSLTSSDTESQQLVQFSRGLSRRLPADKVPGMFLLETDTGTMYCDDTEENRVQVKDPTKLPLTGGEITGDLSVSQSVTAQSFLGNLVGNATSATNAATVNGLTVQTAVPKNAVFTDTTYGNASTSAAGLVSTVAQTFAGNKTFNGQVLPEGATDYGTPQARKLSSGTADATWNSTNSTGNCPPGSWYGQHS